MAKGIPFPQSNGELGAPQGQEKEVYSLPVYKSKPGEPNHPYHVSCWELTKEELEEVKKTDKLYLHIFGPTTYPLYITGHNPWPENKEENEDKQ